MFHKNDNLFSSYLQVGATKPGEPLLVENDGYLIDVGGRTELQIHREVVSIS